MMLCPCGGFVDVSDLVRGRTRYWCRSCGRYEVVEPQPKQDEIDLTAVSSYDPAQILLRER